MRLTRLDRYVGAHIIGAFLVVILVLLGLMGISMLLDELGAVSQRYQLSDAIYFVLLNLPAMAYQLLPLSALVATLIGLGMLASTSELTVMRASGLSLARLILSVLKPVLLLAFGALLLSEFVVPPAQQQAEGFKLEKQQGIASNLRAQTGAWYREPNSFIHVGAILPNGQLLTVVQHQFDSNHRLTETLSAERATFGESGWTLESITQTRFDPNGSQLSMVKSDSIPWQTDLTPELLNVVLVEPRYLALSDLDSYASYLDQQGVDSKRYDLALWNKLLQPLSVVALVLVGTAFIFGPLRSVTVGQRILTGVIVGLVFKFSQDLLAPASQVLGFAAFWAAFTPILVSLAFAGFMLVRVR
ncbi:MAG TPA: LPS export ABC transporter permease LptG [Marinobacterium sp.]|nr:LPS export ABC transporter permease LptG [Marinobacterium sp.]